MKKQGNPFAEALLSWYRVHGRDLPWRSDPTPYKVLVSEFMLQQTRVDTVVPYFNRFMERFPELEDLARSDEDEVLRYWQGLGYYSRTRNLRKSAQVCLNSEQGRLPFDEESLSKLPGVGPYMEKAIRAFAFDIPAVPIDGNLMRVYARLEASSVYPDDPKAKKIAKGYFMERLQSPREFGQALMDLGELVCLPNGEPKCDTCPLCFCCKAHQDGKERDYPLKKQKVRSPVEKRSVLLLLDETGNIALTKRPPSGLLASMDEFPNVRGDEERLLKVFPCEKVSYLGKKSHVFSHVKWEMDVYLGRGTIEGLRYMPLAELREKAALPTAFAKLLSFLA